MTSPDLSEITTNKARATFTQTIPDEVVADVTPLEVGASLHVSDLPLPEGVELVTDSALSVVSVILPRAAESQAAEEAQEEAAEESEATEKPAEGDSD